MAKGELLLAQAGETLETISAFGRTFSINPLKISRRDRTASGRLVEDVVAKKKEFLLSYEIIDEEELNFFLDLDDLDSELDFRFFTNETEYEDYVVLMEPIDRERILCFGDEIWGNVEVLLAEV